MQRFLSSRALTLALACLVVVTALSACGNKGPLKKPRPTATQAE